MHDERGIPGAADMTEVRVGLVQMTSTDDRAANLKAAAAFVAEAAERQASWVALPENFAYMRREGEPIDAAQSLDGDIVQTLRELAQRHAVWLLGGTFAEKIPGDERLYNSSLLLSPDGEIVAHYRKIHLFDVDLGDAGGGAFCESRTFRAGEAPVLAETPFGPVGLSVCYDLRFPELYRRYADAGARFLCVPSAFAPATGRDHWEVLLRARAIENQAFVLAPAQSGRHNASRESYGRAMAVDPWGAVLATAADGPGLILADCDLAELERIRKAVPALAHRRLDP